jgi:hypothetical protein
MRCLQALPSDRQFHATSMDRSNIAKYSMLADDVKSVLAIQVRCGRTSRLGKLGTGQTVGLGRLGARQTGGSADWGLGSRSRKACSASRRFRAPFYVFLGTLRRIASVTSSRIVNRPPYVRLRFSSVNTSCSGPQATEWTFRSSTKSKY